MAKRGWEKGWPKYTWARAIKMVIEEEKIAAKARAAEIARGMTEAQRRERETARQVSIDAKAQFAGLLTLNQSTLLRASGTVAHLSVAGVKLAQYLEKRIKEDVEKGTLPPGAGLSMLNRVSHITERLIRSTHEHLQTHNLFHGEATEILGVTGLPDDLSIEEAERRAEAAMQALKSYKEGHLTVIEGGAETGAKDFEGTEIQEDVG